MISRTSLRQVIAATFLLSLLSSPIPARASEKPGRPTLDRVGPDVIGFCAHEIQAYAKRFGPSDARTRVGHMLELAIDPKRNLTAAGRIQYVHDREAEFLRHASVLDRPGNVGGPEIAQLEACVAGRLLVLLGPSVGTLEIVRANDTKLLSFATWVSGDRVDLSERLPGNWDVLRLFKLESGHAHDLEVSTSEGVYRCSIRIEPGQFTTWILTAGCPEP